MVDRAGDQPLEVVVGDFETVALPADGVDLVVAASSLHWLEPHSGLLRVADLLRPGILVSEQFDGAVRRPYPTAVYTAERR